MSQNFVLSGIQPTGQLHLGNYLGALKNWVALQHTYPCLFCIVDLHAITVPYDPKDLRHNTITTAAMYMAAGIDISKNPIFTQSSVSAHAELGWLFACLTPLGWLNRMTQFKEKAGKKKEIASAGLYTYPVLMAADILIYKATHVPVGEDQKQHLELARDLANTFNHTFDTTFFTLPEPMILGPATRVMSLRDGTSKMSKSDPSDLSRILLLDDSDTIASKIRKAKTDSGHFPGDPSEIEGRPEVRNLITIYQALSGQSIQEICGMFGGAASFDAFKKALTALIEANLHPLRARFHELMEDPGYVMHTLRQGGEFASERASRHLKEIQEIMGFLWTR